MRNLIGEGCVAISSRVADVFSAVPRVKHQLGLCPSRRVKLSRLAQLGDRLASFLDAGFLSDISFNQYSGVSAPHLLFPLASQPVILVLLWS